MDHQQREGQQSTGAEQADNGADQQPDREQVLRETREAGMRAEGGGSADEAEIREAAKQE
jgi:hypothetical protein